MTEAEGTKKTSDAKAAHELLAELRTRISIQPLAYQNGDETSALESLVALFGYAREAIKKNSGCEEFARLTADMLNNDLRPVTAKWHPRSIVGELKTRDGAADFRSDLAVLRIRLRDFANTLHNMAYGSDLSDIETPPVIDQDMLDEIFADLPFGIPEGHLIARRSMKLKPSKSRQDGERPSRQCRTVLGWPCRAAASGRPVSVWAPARRWRIAACSRMSMSCPPFRAADILALSSLVRWPPAPPNPPLI